MVTVFKMENGEGEEIYTKDLDSKYPIHTPVATSDKSFYDFKALYMSRLSEEIGQLSRNSSAGDDIPKGCSTNNRSFTPPEKKTSRRNLPTEVFRSLVIRRFLIGDSRSPE